MQERVRGTWDQMNMALCIFPQSHQPYLMWAMCYLKLLERSSRWNEDVFTQDFMHEGFNHKESSVVRVHEVLTEQN